MFDRARRLDPSGFRLCITSEKVFQQVLDRIDELTEAASGTPAGDELEFLVNQARLYERTL